MKLSGSFWKNRNTVALIIFTSFLLFTFVASSILTSSEAADPKKKLTEIRKKIKLKRKKVKEAIRKEKSVLSRINAINKDIRKQEAELKKIDRRIAKTQLMILNISKDINTLSKKLDRQKKYLKKRLTSLYKQQYGGYALILFAASDYQDLITRSKYISLAAHHDSRMITKYRNDIKEIAFKRTGLEIQRKNLESIREEAKSKRLSLRNDLVRKDRLLATIRSKRSTYEKTIRELEESSKKLQKIIRDLEKQKKSREYAGRKFRSLKGRLSWPINGRVVVPYGKYKDPKFNITVFKNGIEIKGPMGARPKAVADGKVVYADWFKGYGLLLIISHGSGYHSLYGNLSEIFHNTGDIIRKGTAVGKIGVSNMLNIPTLYFEIRYKGKPVNPLRWLKRKRRGKLAEKNSM